MDEYVIHASEVRRSLAKYKVKRLNGNGGRNDYKLSREERIAIKIRNLKNGFTDEKLKKLKLLDELDKKCR